MLIGAVPASFAGQLADRYGQLRAIVVGSSIFTLGVIFAWSIIICAACALGREELWRDWAKDLGYPVFPCMSGLYLMQYRDLKD